VADAVSGLPQAILDRLDNVAIVVADVPPANVLGEGDEILLGLYEGVPQPDRAFGAPVLPDRITLYRRPLEQRAATKADLALLVQETVVHEVAHHFGLDDDELDELGWG
jgi:predicted Zn-dependent protease with MMP-like domain